MLELITDILNGYLHRKRQSLNIDIKGKFIILKQCLPKKPNIYKEFIVSLHYVSPTGAEEILCITDVCKCTEEDKEKQWNKMSKDYGINVLDFVNSTNFENIIYGSVNTNQ